MGAVFAKDKDGRTKELTRVRCKDETRELQDVLEYNPDLIPGDQIKPEDPRRWLIVKREMPIPDPNSGAGRWSLDFVMVDQSAVLTFVECKRHQDTRSRREVIGQVFEYMANAQFYWTPEFLRTYAEETARRRNSTLESLMESLQPDEALEIEDIDDFFTQAVANLKEGLVRVVFFLDEAPRELKSLADFLNRQMKRAEVLVVEAKQYSDGQNIIIAPQLFGYTEQARLSKEMVRVMPAGSRSRRKWDEASFFEDARKKLGTNEVAAMRTLYDFAKTVSDVIDWGTGNRNGSFNPKTTSICPRAPFSVYSDGVLRLNFGWLNGSEGAEAFRDLMFEAFRTDKTLELAPDAIETFPEFGIDRWGRKAAGIVAVLEDVFTRFKESSGGGTQARRGDSS